MGPIITDVEAISYGRLIGLNTDNAAPPSNAYINPDDQMAVYIASSMMNQAVVITARILLPDGTLVPNQWTYVSQGGRIGTAFIQQLTEGFLLSLCVENDSTVGPGVTFVRVSLVRGNKAKVTLTQVLLQGYTSLANVLSWPPAVLFSSTSGRGNIRSITGTTPGAGVNVSEVVPAFALWRLIAFQVQLTTGAAVATRNMVLTFDDGANVFAQIATAATQAASLAVTYSYVAGVVTPAALNTLANNPLPIEMYLQPGFRIRTAVASLQAADQLSAVQYLVEEWLQI
jgi:hypothetical protein